MSKPVKYLIKLLFVIIIPTATIGVSLNLLLMNTFNGNKLPVILVIGLILLIIVSIIDTIIYSQIMYDIKVRPDIKLRVMPIVGLAIAYERNDNLFTIILPFLLIEINGRLKTKSKEK